MSVWAIVLLAWAGALLLVLAFGFQAGRMRERRQARRRGEPDWTGLVPPWERD